MPSGPQDTACMTALTFLSSSASTTVPTPAPARIKAPVMVLLTQPPKQEPSEVLASATKHDVISDDGSCWKGTGVSTGNRGTQAWAAH